VLPGDPPTRADGQDEGAASKFQDLGFAYETLSDEALRKTYDRGGEEAVNKQGQGGGGGGNPFGSMFGNFFGQNGGNDDDGSMPKGENMDMGLDVSLEQLYNGDFIEMLRVKPVTREVPGTRECNCRNEMKTYQMGNGTFRIDLFVDSCSA
jgi:DnaJ family protein B protein 11